ncbi:MAG: hypothetical protein QNJ47_27685 [Nostocaceae cyanobacterium]|nr:hypothetical protein [Nostocaceae cyanobacterium]
MNNKTKIAFSCYLIGILIIASIAIIYLFTPQLLPYQEQAIGTSWSELNSGLQTQFLSLMKVSGGGYISLAVTLTVLLLIPFRKGENWARWAIPAIGIPAILIVNYAGLTIILNTPGRPPIIAGPVAIVFFLAGLILSADIQELKADNLSQSSD